GLPAMLATMEGHRGEPKQIWPEGAWPCFSPDGASLVFTAGPESPSSRLMILAAEGDCEPRYITPPDMNAKRPAWLFSGTEIAFNSGQARIWTLDLDTGRTDPFLAESDTSSRSFVHPCAYPAERAVVVASFRQTPNGREGVLFKLTPGAAVPVLQLT